MICYLAYWSILRELYEMYCYLIRLLQCLRLGEVVDLGSLR